jgi:hypothetical protein
VTEDIAPTIDSVIGTDSGEEIPEGSDTVERNVTLFGEAAKGERVEIFDLGASIDTVSVDASGKWRFPIATLSITKHSFTAKAKYGSEQVSAARTLTVTSELIVDTSPLTLNQLNYTIDYAAASWVRTGNDPAGTSETRTVSGGVPPYSFTTNALGIASVDCAGCIRSEGNGEAVITISDTIGQTKTINVKCENVRRLLINPIRGSSAQALAWIDANGLRINGIDKILGAILATKYKPLVYISFYTGVNNDGSQNTRSAVIVGPSYENPQYLRHMAIFDQNRWGAIALQR